MTLNDLYDRYFALLLQIGRFVANYIEMVEARLAHISDQIHRDASTATDSGINKHRLSPLPTIVMSQKVKTIQLPIPVLPDYSVALLHGRMHHFC